MRLQRCKPLVCGNYHAHTTFEPASARRGLPYQTCCPRYVALLSLENSRRKYEFHHLRCTADPRPFRMHPSERGTSACWKFANAEHHLTRTCYPVVPLMRPVVLALSRQSTLLPSRESLRRCLAAVLIPSSPLQTGHCQRSHWLWVVQRCWGSLNEKCFSGLGSLHAIHCINQTASYQTRVLTTF